MRSERELTLTVELDAPPLRQCEMVIDSEYTQRDTIARLEGAIDNETSGGNCEIEIRVRDANGNERGSERSHEISCGRYRPAFRIRPGLIMQERKRAMNLSMIVQRGWDLFGAGDFDALVTDYVDDMKFVFPGQTSVIEGRQAFRAALDGIGDSVPPGFDIVGLRHIEGDNEVVSIAEWKSDKIASSQLAILFRFDGNRIQEERWFIDTEQWKSAF